MHCAVIQYLAPIYTLLTIHVYTAVAAFEKQAIVSSEHNSWSVTQLLLQLFEVQYECEF
jgi:hypothetical protein